MPIFNKKNSVEQCPLVSEKGGLNAILVYFHFFCGFRLIIKNKNSSGNISFIYKPWGSTHLSLGLSYNDSITSFKHKMITSSFFNGFFVVSLLSTVYVLLLIPSKLYNFAFYIVLYLTETRGTLRTNRCQYATKPTVHFDRVW